MKVIGGIAIVCKWDLRRVAARFYPSSHSLQRKWLRAWRRAPGPRVPVGTRSDEEKLDAKRGVAKQYLDQRRCPKCRAANG